MRKTALANAFVSALLCIVASLAGTRPALGGVDGNVDAAHARFITADGAVHADNINSAEGTAWFVVKIDHDHSYEIAAWAPRNNLLQADAALAMGITELDGTTPVSVSPTANREPEMFDSTGVVGVGGNRSNLANTGSGISREIKIRIDKYPSGPPAGTVPIYVRVIDTTQTAARWTVNGYQAFFALNNLSDNFVANGSIIYYSQSGAFLAADPFSIPANGSVQIVKPNSVAIAGQLAGGVRLVFSDAMAGQIKAQEYNFNAVSGQYLTFDFSPVFQSAAGIQF